MKLTLITRKIIRPCLALAPVDTLGDETLSKAKEGQEFYTEAVSHIPPTLKQFRTMHWLAKLLYENDPQNRFMDKDHALARLMAMCGHQKTWINPVTLTVELGAKSLRDLSREELSALIETSQAIVAGELRTTKPEIAREIFLRIGSS
jgi:hypothetical protein